MGKSLTPYIFQDKNGLFATSYCKRKFYRVKNILYLRCLQGVPEKYNCTNENQENNRNHFKNLHVWMLALKTLTSFSSKFEKKNIQWNKFSNSRKRTRSVSDSHCPIRNSTSTPKVVTSFCRYVTSCYLATSLQKTAGQSILARINSPFHG